MFVYRSECCRVSISSFGVGAAAGRPGVARARGSATDWPKTPVMIPGVARNSESARGMGVRSRGRWRIHTRLNYSGS